MPNLQPWRPIVLPGESVAVIRALGRPVATGAKLPILPNRKPCTSIASTFA